MRRRRKTTAYIGVGSNLGDRKANIEKAMKFLKMTKEINFLGTSSIYETEPAGGLPQGNFLNGVFKIETTLEPFKLLGELQRIEKHLGRKRKIKNGPRTMDLDILLFGRKKVNSKDLVIPHPRMHRREFVLRGLRQLERLRP